MSDCTKESWNHSGYFFVWSECKSHWTKRKISIFAALL